MMLVEVIYNTTHTHSTGDVSFVVVEPREVASVDKDGVELMEKFNDDDDDDQDQTINKERGKQSRAKVKRVRASVLFISQKQLRCSKGLGCWLRLLA